MSEDANVPDPSRRARHMETRGPLLGKYPRSVRFGALGAGVAAIVAIVTAVSYAQPAVTYPGADLAAAYADGTAADDDGADGAGTDEALLLQRGILAASRFEAREELSRIAVEVDGQEFDLVTEAGRLHEALVEAGIVIDEHDEVSVPLGEPVSDGLEVTITRVSVDEVREVETDEYETIEQNDATLLVGQRQVAVEGVDGVTVSVFRERSGGAETDRELLVRTVVSERVDEVVKVGTRQPVTQQRASSSSSSSGSSGSSASGSSGSTASSSGATVSASGNRGIGQDLAAERGWTGDQWTCLDSLWQRESNWNHLAQNSSSGAYGIPQSLPGNKMASVASDWRTNPATQITWGLNYIAGRYGTPCGAWNHSQQRGWY